MDNRHPVGQAVIDRRLEVGYGTMQEAANAARVGTTTWGMLESKGKLPKTARIKRAVCDALRWPSDALDLLEAGRPVAGLPRPVAVSSPPPRDFLVGRVEELQRRMDLQDAAIEGLAGGLEDLRRQVRREKGRPRRTHGAG